MSTSMSARRVCSGTRPSRYHSVRLISAPPNIMMAFGVAVIASQIGTSDVGNQVLLGLQHLDAKLAFSAGFCIVFAAIALDRITTGERSTRHGTRTSFVSRRKLWIACLVIVVVAAVASIVFGVEDFPSWRIGIGSWAKAVIDWLHEN